MEWRMRNDEQTTGHASDRPALLYSQVPLRLVPAPDPVSNTSSRTPAREQERLVELHAADGGMVRW